MSRDYKKIVAWERGHELTLAIYQVTKNFPIEERYGLISQIRRAAYGTPSNIAEGSGRDSKKDYLRFLYIAQASLKETEYFLLLSRNLGYIPSDRHDHVSQIVNGAFSPLHGLIKAVQKEVGLFGRSWVLLANFFALTLASPLR
jgi:four helix bundle protein